MIVITNTSKFPCGCISEAMGERRETAESAENDKKPKRPETRALEFVNITHPDQSKEKAVLTTVRKAAMNYHVHQNSSPDLDEKDKVSRRPRHLRSGLSRGSGTLLSEPRAQRASSVPKETDTRPLLTPGSDQELLRRVSVDVFSRQSTPQKKRSRSEEEPQEYNPPGVTRPKIENTYPVMQPPDMQVHMQMLKRNCKYTEDLGVSNHADGSR